MPGIQKLYEKFKNNDNIKFILVSHEDNKTVDDFVSKREYTFPVYTSKFKAPDIFYSNSIPVTFVISKTGKIVIKETGAVNWGSEKTEKIIMDLLNE
jgi:peroxiredoxin